MTPTKETRIWLAIKDRVDTLPVSYSVIEPGEVFEPSSGPFILVSDIRNETARMGIDPRLHEHSGTLILQARWPIANPVSRTQMVEIGGKIAEYFPADTMMQYGGVCVRVIQDATMLQPDVDGAYRVVTVRVLWSTV